MKEITGYAVQATDGETGHAGDFIVDLEGLDHPLYGNRHAEVAARKEKALSGPVDCRNKLERRACVWGRRRGRHQAQPSTPLPPPGPRVRGTPFSATTGAQGKGKGRRLCRSRALSAVAYDAATTLSRPSAFAR
ncbi:MAG: hypothetical protein U0411_14540 [Thermodesulfovibrionales bacterium]